MERQQIDQQIVVHLENASFHNTKKHPVLVLELDDDEEEEESQHDYKSIDANTTGHDSIATQSEFDLEMFRKKRSTFKSLKGSLPTPETPHREKKVDINFLGIIFNIEILQERNRDPIFFLKLVTSCSILFAITLGVIFIVGFKYSKTIILVCLIIIFCSWILFIRICQKSIKNGLQLTVQIVSSLIISLICSTGLFIYSFIIKTPFNSLPIFLLASQLWLFFSCFLVALIFLPNDAPFDDINYQLRFFSTRLIMAFFNGTGALDVLSDMALGIQLIRNNSVNYLKFLSVVLFIFCLVDYFELSKRIFMPAKVRQKDYLITIVAEIFILGLTLVILSGVQKNHKQQKNDDTLIVAIISLMTTVINFLHHLFRIFEEFFNNRNRSVATK
eukprot:TRINITY_DN17597_c0_g1_i1.p1 TRINITY_DN17597_c0_g1~~TRINITY_DN17597_c0_g1_i1.p1  ORF type:complete len:424 (-),score=33.28 TRINITY_DN17597_c0_g1_i1:155-1318(-)